jgi:hypothetical protein
MVNARSGNIHGVGAACCAVCVDAMGKLMMTNHWPLEADTIVGEQKANVKARITACGGPIGTTWSILLFFKTQFTIPLRTGLPLVNILERIV